MTKKKVVRDFPPNKKNFKPPKTFYKFFHKILHHFQKFYTILEGKDGNLFHLS